MNIASKIKEKTGIVTRVSGQMDDLKFANNEKKKKKIDLVAIGRKFINEPNFLFKYAKKNKIKRLLIINT